MKRETWRSCLEAAKVLGRGAFAKQPIFASPHDNTGHLRGRLLAVAVDGVCERRGDKACDEKDKGDDYQ